MLPVPIQQTERSKVPTAKPWLNGLPLGSTNFAYGPPDSTTNVALTSAGGRRLSKPKNSCEYGVLGDKKIVVGPCAEGRNVTEPNVPSPSFLTPTFG